MIAFLPELYPDELFSSFCARYHEIMGYRCREATGRDLFGKEMAKPAFDFPSNLGALVKRVPFTDWRTVDQLIDQHTLFPFYAPFLPATRIAQVRADMRDDKGGSIHARLGVLTHRLRIQNLRFCRMCVEADRAEFNETYWHRLHQLAGVIVCPIHKIFLDESATNPRLRGRDKEFPTAETSVIDLPFKCIDNNNRNHEMQLQLAQNAQWLLNRPQADNEGSEGNRERYFALLHARRLSGYSGRVRLIALCDAIKDHYPSDLLEQFSCAFNGPHNWVVRLIHDMETAQDPIEHLLLIQFLGLSAEDFFNEPSRRQPFGEGPWPCLNPSCESFRQPTITRYELDSRTIFLNPKGIFRCSCGLEYYRIGPDTSLSDPYYAHGFHAVTEAWKTTLTDLALENTALKFLAHHFCTNAPAIRKALLSLGFRYSRKPNRALPLIVLTARGDNSDSDRLRTRKQKRREWQSLRGDHPNLARTAFRQMNVELYAWLLRHDKQWLDRHLPRRQKCTGPGFRYDWHKVDRDLSKRVRQEAQSIMIASGKPVRVSQTLIARRLGKLAPIKKRKHLLPLTCQALAEATETIEEFVIRRIQLKAECLRSEGVPFTRWDLRARAAVSNEVMTKYPLVRATLEAAVAAAA